MENQIESELIMVTLKQELHKPYFDAINDDISYFQDSVIKTEDMDCAAFTSVRWATLYAYVKKYRNVALERRKQDTDVRVVGW